VAVGHLTDVASADPDSTGSLGAPDLALAYADQADGDAGAPAAPMGIAALRTAALAAHATVPDDTTIAVKRAADQVASTVMTASASAVTVIKSGAHFANPWLRAMVLSPS